MGFLLWLSRMLIVSNGMVRKIKSLSLRLINSTKIEILKTGLKFLHSSNRI